MPTRALEAHVRHKKPRVAVIDLHGEINGFAEAILNDAYAEAEGEHPDVILLNFADVDYINSTGIALIVSLMAKARTAGCRVVACSLSKHYEEIFQITRLSDFMTIYPDQNTALKSETN